MGLIPWQFFLIGDTAESPLHARTLTCTHTDMHGHRQVRGVPVGRWPPGREASPQTLTSQHFDLGPPTSRTNPRCENFCGWDPPVRSIWSRSLS